MRLARSPLPWLLMLSLVACGDDTPKKSDSADVTQGDSDDATDTVTPPGEPFAFGVAGPARPISEAPFPNDLVRADGTGLVTIAPLADDTRFAALANAQVIERLSEQIARRPGFSFESSVFFPMGVEPDLASFAGKAHYVALDGPEVGKVFDGEVSWFAPAQYLGVTPRWGNYLVPGSKYAVFIDVGGKDKDGQVIAAPDAWSDVIAADAPSGASADMTRARSLYEPLRTFLATRDQATVIGTVFTTEDAMAYLHALLTAARAQPLVTPTRNVRSTSDTTLTWETAVDIHGDEALADYFGAPGTDPAFALTPGGWEDGNRNAAKALTADGQPYTGGTFAQQIGWVVNGSIVVPSFDLEPNTTTMDADGAPINWVSGAAVPRSKAVVPFSVFFCAKQVEGDALTTEPIPVAIFTHGGTALRSDGLAFANLNCLSGRATIVLDLPFHGGRQKVRYFAGDDLVVPVQADSESTYKPDGAPGRTNDYIGDNGGATTTVGGLFALNKALDPEIIEANILQVAVDHDTLVRYLDETGPTGLGAALGVTFDTSDLVHESLSFGTSFGTAFLAGSDRIAKVVMSVGSGMMLSVNLPMAPNNAQLATGLMVTVLKLKSSGAQLQAGAYRDPVVAMFQWIAQRGDPLAYAPFALRYRTDGHKMDVIGFGDSWDETLFTPAQISFDNAWGLPVFESAGWKLVSDIPGADTVVATTPSTPPSDNLTFGTRTQSGGFYYFGAACHAEVVTPLCQSSYQPPYPPPTPRATPLITQSPICAIQKSVSAFLEAEPGEAPSIVAPPAPSASDCSDLYD